VKPENQQLPRPDEPVPLELGAIYEAHAARVASWAAQLGGPKLEAADLTHEVFLRVERELPSFRGQARLTTWLYGITANVVREHRRAASRRRLRHLFGGRAQHSQRTPTPVEALERRQASALVYDVLDRMNDKYRSVMILFEIEGLSGEEIAELTGVKLDSVWVRLHRARAQFRALLAKHHPDALRAEVGR
jgi:RNA polymerase sigma-70 factor, ECF subfamily